MAEALHITVCFSPAPRRVCELALTLPAGSRLQHAVALAVQQPGWPEGWGQAQCQALTPALWGRKADWSAVLREGALNQGATELFNPWADAVAAQVSGLRQAG